MLALVQGSGRKKLIDWSQWERDYGTRVSQTDREREMLLSIQEYWTEVGRPQGRTRAESDADFKLLLRGAHEHEGEGAEVRIWVERPRERIRDNTRYIDARMREKSKGIKAIDKGERDELIGLTGKSLPDETSSWLRAANMMGKSSNSAHAKAHRCQG